VCDSLVSTLSFLSEDEYHFEFEHLTKDPSLDGYLDFGTTPYDGIIEEVIPFSGGLDSLGGAVHEAVIEKRKVLLVNHRSTEKLTPRHQHLLELLDGHAGDFDPIHFPVRVNKEKGLSREYTQRTRSALYMALAATVAAMIGLDRIRFYENGVISLNLPPCAQVVGARATRTTHPRVLNGFSKLLSSLVGRPFTVENGFLWKTKAEVVRGIGAAGCNDLIRHATSCTHTWEMTRQHTHCGKCSQCIDRRFGVLAAGLESDDPAEAYKANLLVGPREGDDRTMLAAYVETATEISRMSEVEFFGHYGEATRVLRELGGDVNDVGRRIFELYQRHARGVTEVVDLAIAKYAPAIRARELPPTCLVRMVCDTGTAGTNEEPPKAPEQPENEPNSSRPENGFRRRGQAWEVWFAGGNDFILLPIKGAAYLYILLAQPHSPISAVEMACRVARNPTEHVLGTAGLDVRMSCAGAGLRVRQCLVWVKSVLVMGRQDYQWKREPCLYGWADGASHTWLSDRAQTTVLEFDKPARNADHPTTKPVDLFAYLIGNSCKKGGVVLDPFAGSGTSLVAAEQTGRTVALVELDPRYCDVVVARYEALSGRKAERVAAATP
jgi:hypothetical protein